jgi:hypothetical protein
MASTIRNLENNMKKRYKELTGDDLPSFFDQINDSERKELMATAEYRDIAEILNMTHIPGYETTGKRFENDITYDFIMSFLPEQRGTATEKEVKSISEETPSSEDPQSLLSAPSEISSQEPKTSLLGGISDKEMDQIDEEIGRQEAQKMAEDLLKVPHKFTRSELEAVLTVPFGRSPLSDEKKNEIIQIYFSRV